jgi:uncharacterized membrane protein
MEKLRVIGRYFFAIAMVAFGVQHLIYLNFVTRVVPPLPAWIPGRGLLAAVFGALLVIAGVAIISGFAGRSAALLLGGMMLVSFVALYIPLLLASPKNGGLWTSAGKALALAGGGFLVAGSLPAGSHRGWLGVIIKALERLIPAGRFFLAAFLMLGGYLHFIYIDFVISLVPGWIPGQRFWAYATGVALIAGGLGIIIPLTTRLAATLSALMIFIWVLCLHIPRAVVSHRSANETTAVFEALAMSGIALLIAARAASQEKSAAKESERAELNVADVLQG